MISQHMAVVHLPDIKEVTVPSNKDEEVQRSHFHVNPLSLDYGNPLLCHQVLPYLKFLAFISHHLQPVIILCASFREVSKPSLEKPKIYGIVY